MSRMGESQDDMSGVGDGRSLDHVFEVSKHFVLPIIGTDELSSSVTTSPSNLSTITMMTTQTIQWTKQT
eukprot:scaffold2837_cov152-Alexandrium_tamarense.AAC.1